MNALHSKHTEDKHPMLNINSWLSDIVNRTLMLCCLVDYFQVQLEGIIPRIVSNCNCNQRRQPSTCMQQMQSLMVPHLAQMGLVPASHIYPLPKTEKLHQYNSANVDRLSYIITTPKNIGTINFIKQENKPRMKKSNTTSI